MSRKLSNIEHILDGNILYFVRLEGSLNLDELRSAIARVQRKHPALRTLIREKYDGLYYEEDSAPGIPLRIVPRLSEDDYRRECQTELATAFAYDLPQLRVVWLQSEGESDLLLTTSHRICDGMSMFIIVREILKSLHSDEELIPYEPITTQDIIGNYQPPQPWKTRLKVSLLNSLLRLVPKSPQTPENNEHYLEWKANRAMSDALRKRCKVEGVSVHAALVVALDRTLFAAFGKDNLPKWIGNQIDPRRGRFPALKSDTVFFGGGSFKVRTGQALEEEFWDRARSIHEEIPRQIAQELLNIPRRFHFIEMLRPLTSGQVQSILRLNDALTFNRCNSFALSNLGNVVIDDSDAPFRLKDLRLYLHSFKTRALGLVSYTLNGEMRFYCVSNEKCLSPNQVDALKREFMAVLEHQTYKTEDDVIEIPAHADCATCSLPVQQTAEHPFRAE